MSKANVSTKRAGRRAIEKKVYSVEALLQKAEDALVTYQPELAEKFYKRALETNPKHASALDAYGTFLLDMDRFDEAKQMFVRSIEISPKDDAGKYMNMGQICEGAEAILWYNKGVDLLLEQLEESQAAVMEGGGGDGEEEMDDPDKDGDDDADEEDEASPEEVVAIFKSQISSAYCSIAEVYLTDNCFEENAESECERLLQLAISYDADNYEPLQTLASVRMSQQRPADALELMRRSYAQWSDLDVEDKPSFEFRHNAGKLFLELEQFEEAETVWADMLDEDDTVAELFYFKALACKKADPVESLACARRAKELLEESGCDDPLLQEQVAEILAEADSLVKAIPSGDDVGDGDDVEEGEGEDDDDDDDADDMND